MRRKGIHAFGANGVLIVMSMVMALCLGGCGKEEAAGQEDKAVVTQEVSAEVSEEEQQVIGETAEESVGESVEELEAAETSEEAELKEDATANLSDEEWIKSLNLDTGTYLIFNETTGERKVLEEGQEYKISESDVLAFWWPLDWKIRNERMDVSYEPGNKYDCKFMYINYDEVTQKSEVTMDVDDAEGNRHSFTVYLSK